MAKSDDGHYELVLGNRQLVSGFFVLVILFAIFLTLGYILGRNSVVVNEPATTAAVPSASGTAANQGATASEGRPSASEALTEQPPAASEGPVTSTAAQSGSATQPAQLPAVEAKPETTTLSNPAASAPAASAAAVTAPVASAPVKPAASPATAADRTREVLGGKVQLITPRKGDVFLQVAAIGRPEAELMAEQLQKRNYRAFLSEVPGKDLFRVLIGPFETAPRMNEVKKKLAEDGLPSIVQRY